MRRQRRVKEMTGAAQRFRRRVLGMLDARISGLAALYQQTEESKAHVRALGSLYEAIKGLR